MAKLDYVGKSISLNTPGAKHIAFINAHKFGGHIRAIEATVRATSTSPKFALRLNGNNLHASTSVAASNVAETITFTQNQYAAGDIVELDLNVVASGSGGTMDVSVLIEASPPAE